MVKKKPILFLSGLLLVSQDLTSKRLGNWLTNHKLMAIKHLPDSVELIDRVFKDCVIMILLMKTSKLFRNKIFSTLVFPLKNKWTIFLDKLNTSSNLSSLTTLLFKILVQELTSNEKGYQPFWTPVYRELSGKLSLPTGTGLVDSPLNLLNSSSLKVVEKSPFLTTTEINLPKQNCQKTYYQLSTSSIVDKWGKEVTNPELLKTIKIKLYPTQNQCQKLDNIIDTHRYVYNRTVEYIKKLGYDNNFQDLRNLLATERTKSTHQLNKYHSIVIRKLKEKMNNENINEQREYYKKLINEEEKSLKEELKKLPYKRNPMVRDFELETSNEIRSNAIKSVCDAYKTGFSNLKAGNINYFNMNFKKKISEKKCVELASSEVSMKNNMINICPGKLYQDSLFRISRKNIKKFGNINIVKNSDLVKHKGNYYLHMTVKVDMKENKIFKVACGGDPGVRTFLTTYSNNNKVYEYKHNEILLKKLNDKLRLLKSLRTRPRNQNERNKYRKRHLNKVEKKKSDSVDELHWSVINHLVKTNDVIFMGDIKSHNIVKNSYNKTLNRNFNDLKFYKFKQRLLYKALLNNKKAYLVNEAFTTQGCSKCGYLWRTIGNSEIFKCTKCKFRCGRDINAPKNILMKGIINNL